MKTAPRHPSLAIAVVVAVVAYGTPAIADVTKCKGAIVQASAKFIQAEIKLLEKCEQKILSGRLPRATVCGSDPPTALKLSKARDKLRTGIAKACGGKNRRCNPADTGKDADDPLTSIGWDIGQCPNLERSADPNCTVPLVDCDDIAICLSCVGEAAVRRAVDLYYDDLAALDPANDTSHILAKCQKEIGKSAAEFFQTKSRILRKCWDQVNKGKTQRPCPVPGDGKAARAIAKAEAKMIARICNACGAGGDQVTTGTSAKPADGICDAHQKAFSPAQIGFGQICPDVQIPGGKDCGAIGAIEHLQDLIDCVDCVTDFEVDCVDRNAVPAAELGGPYPLECNLYRLATPTPTPAPAITGSFGLASRTATPQATPSPAITDTDGDGVPDDEDACPSDAAGYIDADGDGICDESDSEFVLRWADVNPRVVHDVDLPDTVFTATAYATGNDVQMRLSFNSSLADQPYSPPQTLPMFDDGTHGDVAASDHIFTRTFQPGIVPPATLGFYDHSVSYFRVSSLGVDGQGTLINSPYQNRGSSLIGILAANVSVPLELITPTVRASSRVVNVIRPWFADSSDFQSLMREVYRAYHDDFAFAVVFTYGRSSFRELYNGVPFSGGISNTIAGLGRSILDSSAKFGSQGALQQVISMQRQLTGEALLHEIGHRWVAYFRDPALRLAQAGGHFGLSTHGGQNGGGNFLRDIGNNQYRISNYVADNISVFPHLKYSALEQYLMCLRAKHTVPPYYFYLGTQLPPFGSIIPKSVTTEVTPDSIAAVYGPLSPDFSTCPKSFKTITIIVSDEFVTPVEHSFADRIMEYYATSSTEGSLVQFSHPNPPSFAAATDHAGTLDVDIAGSRR